MSRESNRAKAPNFAAAMDEIRQSIPAEAIKVRYVKEGDFEAGAWPEEEPGTYWMDGGVWEQSVRLYEQQTMPKRGR